MKYLLYKSKLHLRKFISTELLYIQYKILLCNVKLPYHLRLGVFYDLCKLKSSRSKFRKRCVVTGFSRSFRRLSFSRITFREFASYGYFNGIRKSSW